jgi:hypothetical protein
MDIIRGPRLKRAWVARRGLGPAPPVIKWASWPPSLTSCAPGASRGKILTSEKSQVNLSPGKFLKRKNTQNRFSCSAELLPK